MAHNAASRTTDTTCGAREGGREGERERERGRQTVGLEQAVGELPHLSSREALRPFNKLFQRYTIMNGSLAKLQLSVGKTSRSVK